MVKIESLFGGKKYNYMLEDFSYIAKSDLNFEKLKNKTVLIIGENDAINESIVFSLLLRNDLFGDNIRVISAGRLNKQDRSDFIAVKSFFDGYDKISESDIDFIILISSDYYTLPRSKKSIGALLSESKTLVSSAAALALRKGARLLFVSPMDIYGAVYNGFKPIKESELGYVSLTDSENLSGAAARFSETLLYSFAIEKKISLSFARLPIVCGYGRGLCSKKSREIFALIQASKSGAAVLPALADEKMSTVYLADCVRAILFILLDGMNNEAYNIAFDDNTLTLRMILTLSERLQGKNPTAGEPLESSFMTPCLLLDGEKLSGLDFKGHLTPEQGIQRILSL